MTIIMLRAAMAASLVCAGAANAATAIATTSDISVYVNSSSTQAFPNSGYAGSAGDGEVARDYLKFTIPLSAGSSIVSAVLNLSYGSAYNNASLPLSIYAASSSWDSSITWSSQPGLGAALATFNPTTSGVYSLDLTSYANSQFLAGGSISFIVAASNEYFSGSTPNSWRYFSGGNETLTYSTSSVPEPAGWAMMLVGFGALGLTMRRTRRVSVSFR